MTRQCTHTTDWWKNMVACACCGEPYSDEESERVERESSRSHPVFTAAQQAFIDAHNREESNDAQ
jgi:hypothetical protein